MLAPGTAASGRTKTVSEAVPSQEATAPGCREAGPGWYVVHTKQHCEEQALAHLGRRGVRAYLPRARRWPRPAVGSGVGPLLPGYLFVHVDLDTQYYSVAWAPGVRRFVCFDQGMPPAVSPAAVTFFQSREDGNGLVKLDDENGHGRAVRIARGAFRDLHGVIERRLPERDRVVLLMNFLQRQVRVEVPETWVRPE